MPQTYQPLYLKYRPQSLNDLVGQHSVATTLTNAIEHDRISHAYLFTGPRGCGKTSSARIMAKSLNCDKGPTAVPCQECTACIEIRQVNSPSVIEIDAASNNSVDDARTLIERAPLVSAGGRYKLYIIDECHMLTKEAFNALLKTIEEPPPKVIFILATTEEHKVPPTIVSRCQRLMFRLINHKELARYLRKVADQEQISIDDAAVELIARRSGGGLRDALGLLDQASLLASPDKPIALNDLLTLLGSVHEDALLSISQAMSDRNGQSVLEEASKLLTEGREPALIALELAKHFLNLAKASYASDAEMSADALDNALILGSPTYLAQLRQQAPNFDATELAQMVEQLDRLEQSCRRSSQPALTLEIGLLSLCHRLEITELRQLKARLEALESRFATEGGGRPPQIDTRRPQSSPAAAHPPAGPAAAHPPASPAAAHPPASPVAAHPPEATASEVVSVGILTEADGESTADTSSATRCDVEDRAEALTPAPESAAPEAPAPSPQTPVASAEAPAPSPNAQASDEVDFALVDEVWSGMLEILHERHLPTYSLFNSGQVIPMSFNNDELIIGVKEMLQKTIENKLEHARNAAQVVVGRPVNVKLKVLAKDGPQALAQKKRSTQSAPENRQEQQPSTARTAENARLPEANNTSPAPQVAAVSANSQASPAAEATSPREDVSGSEEASKGKKPSAGGEPKSQLAAEAYKLFEGPGSRQFGD